MLMAHIEKNKARYENEQMIQKNYQWGNKFNFFLKDQAQTGKKTFETDVKIITNDSASPHKLGK